MSGAQKPTDLMRQHTPGPWHVGGGTGQRYQLSIRSADGTTIGCVYGREDHAVVQADAALIETAPALLALARQCAAECAECNGVGLIRRVDFEGTPIEDVPCPDCADIRTIINKAEGRS